MEWKIILDALIADTKKNSARRTLDVQTDLYGIIKKLRF